MFKRITICLKFSKDCGQGRKKLTLTGRKWGGNSGIQCYCQMHCTPNHPDFYPEVLEHIIASLFACQQEVACLEP